MRISTTLLLLGAAFSTACGSDESNDPTAAESFVGFWVQTDFDTALVCNGEPQEGGSTEEYTFQIRAGSKGGIEVVELDQTDLKTEECVYRYKVNGRSATLDGEQSCTISLDSSDEFMVTVTWTEDNLTLSSDGDRLNSSGRWFNSDGCEATLTASYERK